MLPDPRHYFADLADPAAKPKINCTNSPIIMIVFRAILSGIKDWGAIETFAEEKEDWFRTFLELPNGIPPNDILSNVPGRLHPDISAEIELAILSNSCLPQRIPDKDTLRREVEANVREHNVKATPINWRFTTRDARLKLAQTVKNAT